MFLGAGDAVKDRIKTVSGAASAAPKTIETIHSMRKALDTGKVSSGPGTTFGMALKQIGQSMGMGVDQEALNKTRTVITGLAEMTLQARGELKGQGQVTEYEQNCWNVRAPETSIGCLSARSGRFWISANGRNVTGYKRTAALWKNQISRRSNGCDSVP